MLFNTKIICIHWISTQFNLKISGPSFTSGLRKNKGCQAVCHKQNLYSEGLERERAEGGALSSTLNKDIHLQSLLVVPKNKKPKWQENQHSWCFSTKHNESNADCIPNAIKTSRQVLSESEADPCWDKELFCQYSSDSLYRLGVCLLTSHNWVDRFRTQFSVLFRIGKHLNSTQRWHSRFSCVSDGVGWLEHSSNLHINSQKMGKA